MARLRVKNGPLSGHAIEVNEQIVIGRENVDLVVDDELVSRRHVAVRSGSRVLEVEDLGSSNGTFVDGERITEPTQVGAGAEIRIGTTVLAVEGVLPAEQTRVSAGSDAVADSQRTRASEPPVPAVGDLQTTRARQVPDLQTTRASARPRQGSAGEGPPAAAYAGAQGAAVAVFSPPARRRRRGLASRSWIPVVLSFGTAIAVAVALVVYFATR
jgi:pSer/pThr/pTyr-binding forkhead associated (FHA) protein